MPGANPNSELSSQLRVLAPDDADYAQARLSWTRAVDQRPALIAYPASADQLAEVFSLARTQGLTVLPQPRGHGASDAASDSILLRLDAFDTIEIDPEAQRARIGAGVGWRALLEALDAHGTYLPPIGTSDVVSVVGLFLGGGHGWSARRDGLAAQALRRIRLMTPDGRHEWIDDERDPEALWAARGAGGALGVVTEIEIDLRPVPTVFGGSLTFAGGSSAPVLHAVRQLMRAAPDGLSAFVSLMHYPDVAFLPPHLRGARVTSVEVALVDGDPSLLDPVRQAAPLVDDSIRVMRAVDLPEIAGDPREPSASAGGGNFVPAVSDAFIDALTAARDADHSDPIIGMQVRFLGGALDRPARRAIASTQGAEGLLHLVAPALPGVTLARGHEAVRTVREQLAPHIDRSTLPTFLSPGDTWDRSFPPESLVALDEVRARLDPEGLMTLQRMPAAHRGR